MDIIESKIITLSKPALAWPEEFQSYAWLFHTKYRIGKDNNPRNYYWFETLANILSEDGGNQEVPTLQNGKITSKNIEEVLRSRIFINTDSTLYEKMYLPPPPSDLSTQTVTLRKKVLSENPQSASQSETHDDPNEDARDGRSLQRNQQSISSSSSSTSSANDTWKNFVDMAKIALISHFASEETTVTVNECNSTRIAFLVRFGPDIGGDASLLNVVTKYVSSRIVSDLGSTAKLSKCEMSTIGDTRSMGQMILTIGALTPTKISKMSMEMVEGSSFDFNEPKSGRRIHCEMGSFLDGKTDLYSPIRRSQVLVLYMGHLETVMDEEAKKKQRGMCEINPRTLKSSAVEGDNMEDEEDEDTESSIRSTVTSLARLEEEVDRLQARSSSLLDSQDEDDKKLKKNAKKGTSSSSSSSSNIKIRPASKKKRGGNSLKKASQKKSTDNQDELILLTDGINDDGTVSEMTIVAKKSAGKSSSDSAVESKRGKNASSQRDEDIDDSDDIVRRQKGRFGGGSRQF